MLNYGKPRCMWLQATTTPNLIFAYPGTPHWKLSTVIKLNHKARMKVAVLDMAVILPS